MKVRNRVAGWGFFYVVLILLSGCNFPGLAGPSPYHTVTPVPVIPTQVEITPSAVPTETPSPPEEVWVEPYVPAALREAIAQSDRVILAESVETSLHFGIVDEGQTALSRWVFALAAPFPTIVDDVSFDTLRRFWQGESIGPFAGRPLLVSPDTLSILQALWGEPAAGSVQVLAASDLAPAAWENRPSWAILPFEDLEPHWKVLSIDGQSPVRKDFNPETYSLSIPIGFSGSDEAIEIAGMPVSNRDPEKMTVLVMTGVTALVRATAYTMEQNGITYPARDIGDWLREADITHISNEVSFYAECPDPDPNPGPLLFCSKVEYFELIKDVGADVVELTGNHNNDSKQIFGIDVVPPTLYLYRQNGMAYYGGGVNLAEARQPALLEHNGNRLAFIGCNPAGPDYAWATETSPGAAPCEDLQWMQAEVSYLKQEGYLPIATFQWFENYSNAAGPQMERDFRAMAEAGAVIVNGSQAHTPKEMEFFGDSFIHYGLGNLFFDQMHVDLSFLQVGNQRVPATRLEFIDRHVIYDGEHISSELLTAMLEDYARPRPMTAEERAAFLQNIFTAAGW